MNINLPGSTRGSFLGGCTGKVVFTAGQTIIKDFISRFLHVILLHGPCTMHALHSLTSGILKFWRIDCIWEFEDIRKL